MGSRPVARRLLAGIGLRACGLYTEPVNSEQGRRTFLHAMTGGIAISMLIVRLRSQTVERRTINPPNHLRARAIAPVKTPAAAGLRSLGVRDRRDTLVYIPEAASKFAKAPLVLSLHGATQDANGGISLLQKVADEHGFLIVAPASAERTWETEGSWGADFDNVEQSLALSFGLRDIDPGRIAVAGFSDGASYALALGLASGDLFNAVLGFSTGYVAEGTRAGKPAVFLSHGTADPIFPIEATGRAVERVLRREGYAVTLREFEGGHTLPAEVAAEAGRWLMKAQALNT